MLPGPEQRRWLAEATHRYETAVEPALSYLADRGISAEAAVSFRLGYVSPEAVMRGDEGHVGMLAIPYLTLGDVVQIRYRSLPPRDKLYLTRAGDPAHIFNVRALKGTQRTLVVCEGELDTIVLSRLGYAAVGVPGVQSWKRFWNRVVEDFPQVLVVGDGDEAGRELGRRLESEIRARMIPMPDGMDVTDVYTRTDMGEVWLRERLGDPT